MSNKWKKENGKESSAGVAVHLGEEVECTETLNHVEMNHDGLDHDCKDSSVLWIY